MDCLFAILVTALLASTQRTSFSEPIKRTLLIGTRREGPHAVLPTPLGPDLIGWRGEKEAALIHIQKSFPEAKTTGRTSTQKSSVVVMSTPLASIRKCAVENAMDAQSLPILLFMKFAACVQ